MRFLLPKRLDGWRMFLGEVTVIVLGVAIALGAQQLVEDAHWRSATREAVAGMTADALGERGAIIARYQQRHCIDRRLNDLATLFARHDRGQPIGPINRVGRPFYSFGSAPSWEVAVADGSVARLSFDQRQKFANAFDIYEAFAEQMWEEKRAWQQLQMLNHVASFTPADWSEARLAFILANDFQTSFRITIPQYLAEFRVFGPGGPEAQGNAQNRFTTELCKPLFATASP
ncbi:hypothetical protein H9L13_06925 [Sphingomonas lutea]|uniref:Uncharacterized protein n=1 Tax=Sphingomonas lutea TaxID=1045317 RepID=A0A7G9SF38_9SPHN|nr:hypothetical protein [Sphingomonas lutea]QNN66463.1 hypothetical protein H9L13_06925 [Sphingomonas lutea]